VFFSGGLDSTVLAQVAHDVLGADACALTFASPIIPVHDLAEARDAAAAIGIRHVVLDVDELADPSFASNPPDRCYLCRRMRDARGIAWARDHDFPVVADGLNASDLIDYRPGMKAASEHSVRSPLAECGFTKADVRALAEQWELPVWDKPATPCLSSRVAYGEEVTPERLRMIDRAEQLLRDQGLRDVRVRYHRGDLARIEVPADEIAKFIPAATRSKLADQLRQLGFKFVTIDIEGFRSGSLNSLVQLSANASAASPQ